MGSETSRLDPNSSAPSSFASRNLLNRLPSCLSDELWVRSKVLRRWKKRYMEIKGQSLTIRKSPKGDILHVVRLFGYCVEECPNIEPPSEVIRNTAAASDGTEPRPIVFSVTNPNVRDFYFCAVDPIVTEQWISKLNKKISNQVGLDDFEVIRPIGRGGYGDVTLVRKISDGKEYAMKRIGKIIDHDNDLVDAKKRKEKEVKHLQRVLEERASLEGLGHHPFLAQLKYAFQTAEYWYLVQEFIEGSNLYRLARTMNRKRFPEHVVRMWAAELVTAIEYIHNNHVIHRDLKPDNILIGRGGHVHVIDLGLSKSLQDLHYEQSSSRTKTVCGTKYYMSPEMVKGEKYDEMVDWWSLGVILYELLVGVLPFYSRDLKRQFLKIIQCDLILPGERGRADTEPITLSPNARDFLEGLLAKDPKKRLGQDIAVLKQHPWFEGVNWKEVELKQATMSEAAEYVNNYLNNSSPVSRPTAASTPSFDYEVEDQQGGEPDDFRIEGFSYARSIDTAVHDEKDTATSDETMDSDMPHSPMVRLSPLKRITVTRSATNSPNHSPRLLTHLLRKQHSSRAKFATRGHALTTMDILRSTAAS